MLPDIIFHAPTTKHRFTELYIQKNRQRTSADFFNYY